MIDRWAWLLFDVQIENEFLICLLLFDVLNMIVYTERSVLRIW
jgi:hypothetical protein